MREFALDADAFNFLRKLGLLKDLVQLAQPPAPRVALHMTRFVARHELNSSLPELEAMVRDFTLRISEVRTKTPTFALFRDLQRKGYDKGESELGAWIATESRVTILVSCDKRVPEMAKGLKISALDLGQLVAVLVKDGFITEAMIPTTPGASATGPQPTVIDLGAAGARSAPQLLATVSSCCVACPSASGVARGLSGRLTCGEIHVVAALIASDRIESPTFGRIC